MSLEREWVSPKKGVEGVNEILVMVWYQSVLDTNINPGQEE